MTAQEARKIATVITNTVNAKELATVEEAIENAARQGRLDITFYKSISSPVQKELESRGFKLKSGYDQREGDSWITISW